MNYPNQTYPNFFPGWNIGAMLMTLLAFWLRDWSNLQLSFSVISLGLVSIFFLVRLNLARGHY
jgi:hypothetical protein